MRIPALLTAATILLGAVAHAAEPTQLARRYEARSGSAESAEATEPPVPAPAEAPPPSKAPEPYTPPAVPPPSVPPPPAGKAESASPDRPTRTPQHLSMDFTDVDLPVLVKFMSEQTRKNFIFDERVQGKITIISPRKLTVGEAYNVFLSVLQVKGFTTVEQGNTIKIIPAREARQDTIPMGVGKDTLPSAEFITRLVPLQFTESADLLQLLTPLVSKDGMVSAFPASNMLLLIDSRSNIDRLLGIIAEIDVDDGRQLRVFPLAYAQAQEVAKTLESLLRETPAAAAVGRTRRAGGPGTRGSALKIVPDARTNSLVVVAAPETLSQVAELIAKLDISIPSSGRINVYYLENADAEEVSKVLASLSGTKTSQIPVPAAPQRAAVPQASSPGIIAAELEGGVKITADKATNALIIVASANDYISLVEVIKKLDIRRRQVFVEAVIMEIDLDKSLDLGVEWRAAAEVSKGNGAVIGGSNFGIPGGMNALLAGLAAGTPLIFPGSGLVAGGIGGSVTLPDGTKVPAIAAVLRAAQANNNLNVLSAPHLLTQNNKEAEIIVAENIPFISSQSRDSTNLANVINTVERKDVGITLRITPHIHESEFVSMDIYQEASALKSDLRSIAVEATQGPTWTKRSAKTTVLVKTGDTVILGGIMQENSSKNVSKVPLLGDIPLLGYLFKYVSEERKKTNLLIMLTPTIIQEPGRLSKPLADRQRKMLNAFDQNLEEVKRAFPGGPEAEKP